MSKLPLSFYLQDDVLELSRLLLGKYLLTCFNNQLTGGMIVETEAYGAFNDRASHAYGMRRKRHDVMYEAGGICYVYLCYGVYALLNIITNRENVPHAILIRAIEPKIGLDVMLARRGKTKIARNLTAGPGILTQALGISKVHNGVSLMGKEIWIEERGVLVKPEEILASPRVGIDYAGEDALLPWRFRLKNNKWTSPAP